MDNIKVGKVSSFDAASGMASVYFENTGQTTGKMPVFAPFGAKQMLKKDDMVLVAMVGNSKGIVIGGYTAAGGTSMAGIEEKNGGLVLKDSSGSISVDTLLAMKTKLDSL